MNDAEKELLAITRRAANLLLDVGARALDKGLDSVLDDAGQLTEEVKGRIGRARERIKKRVHGVHVEPASPRGNPPRDDGNPFGGGR